MDSSHENANDSEQSGEGKKLKDRLTLALEMFNFGVAMKEQALQREFPGISAEEKRKKLRSWLQTRPGAECGDGQGRVITLESRREP